MAYFIIDENRKYKKADGFQGLFFIAPDIRASEVVDADDEANKFRMFLESIWRFCGDYLEDNWIADYSFVITPKVCDSRFIDNKPKTREKYIVTPFNREEIQLVEKIIVKSQLATGDDRRAVLPFYIAIEVSESNPWLDDVADKTPGNDEYEDALFKAQMSMCNAISEDYYDGKMRVFTSMEETGYFEQYFQRSVKKKTANLNLGPGYFKCRLDSGDNHGKKCQKFIVAMDLFESTGSDFALYGLNKSQLKDGRDEFGNSPWVSIEYKKPE